jgi:hypothetical protein
MNCHSVNGQCSRWDCVPQKEENELLRIHAFCPTIGARIGEGGNPEIVAVDEIHGYIVTIEVESQYWKTVLQKLGQLQGVGIIPANQLPREMGKKVG